MSDATTEATTEATTDAPADATSGAGLLSRLQAALVAMGPVAVAVSGGVDSLTLGVVAGRAGGDVRMVHATSPAVPPEATARVRDWAVREGWALEVIDAGEFDDPNYRANPVDRCFFCKTNLYGAIASRSDRQIVSGANLDDLQEYRPGLQAAQDHRVRHPYVEAQVDKATVRRLSAALGMGAVAELPSSPCLSSRVETGIRIHAPTLGFVHAVETLVAARLQPRTVRCRIRAAGVVVELDAASLAAQPPEALDHLQRAIAALPGAPTAATAGVRFEAYRTGSAFLVRAAA